MFIGAIADDLTGATDLSLMLSREGMRVLQVSGVPDADTRFGDAEAVVVALKSRTIPAADAVKMSLAAAQRLLDSGAQQLLFKYCSTFDSTDEGNIGPVTDALLELLGEGRTIACPAFPANGRTVYMGHLFVGEMLLSDSPMRDHPLTPMRDANLVRVLGRQSTHSVSLIKHAVVAAGPVQLSTALDAHTGIAVVDAITDEDLRVIGAAARGMKLVTGGSGIALGLPANFLPPERLGAADAVFSIQDGRAVVLAGSCSAATRRQVAHAVSAGMPALQLDPVAIADGRQSVKHAIAFVEGNTDALPPLIYSSADPDSVSAVQQRLGRAEAGERVEQFLGAVAKGLAERGFNRFVVAGGETSGAVVEALGVKALEIGPEIDPGVPWTKSCDHDAALALALKSGNFGDDDFFLKALRLVE